jgi:hypothetical protein
VLVWPATLCGGLTHPLALSLRRHGPAHCVSFLPSVFVRCVLPSVVLISNKLHLP